MTTKTSTTIKTVKTTTTILGIDPGTATTGYGLIKKEGQKYKVLDFGCILTPANTPLPDRINHIFDELAEIIEQNKPDQIAVEKLFFAKNTKTAIDVAQARGAILLSAIKSKTPVFEYTPLEVKMAITGYGRADKRQMQEMVKTLLGLKEIPKPDDAADALAIAMCHAQSHRN